MILQATRIKFIVVLCFFLLALKINAQVQFSCFAGLQATSARYLVNGIKQPNKYKPGTMAGVAAKVEFDNQLYFYPSVFYSLKGYKVTLNNPAYPPSELAKSVDATIHTIEVAPLFQYDFNRKASHFLSASDLLLTLYFMVGKAVIQQVPPAQEQPFTDLWTLLLLHMAVLQPRQTCILVMKQEEA